MRWTLFYFLLAFQLLFSQVVSAPTPPRSPSPPPAPPKPGDFVGVRPSAYEGRTKENKKVAIHPGVIVSGPTREGNFKVAMISKKLVGNPPQSPIESFHPQTNVYGNVNLGPPKVVHPTQMKHWKDHKTGAPATPVNPANLDRLKKAMVPHTAWRPTIAGPSRPGKV